MNLLLLHPTDFVGDRSEQDGAILGRVSVEGERLLHLRKVLRVAVGDRLRAGLVNGPIGRGTVRSIDRSRAELEVDLHQPPPIALDADLLLALPRPKFLGRVLQHASAMGVKRIGLAQTARVEKSFWSSNLLDTEAIRRHLCLGLEQGRDTMMPQVELLPRFEDLLEQAARAVAGDRSLLVADGDGMQPFPRSAEGPTTLVIGPEGGLIDRELEALSAAGGRRVSLGQRPLRVETAVAVCLGRLLPDPLTSGSLHSRAEESP